MSITISSSQSIKNLLPSKQSQTEIVHKPKTPDNEEEEQSLNDIQISLPKNLDSDGNLNMATHEELTQIKTLEKNENADINIGDRKLLRLRFIKDFEANRFSRRFLSTLTQIHQPDAYYNALHIPPNWKLAKNHGEARSVGIPIKSNDEVNICMCCGYEIKRKPLKFTDSTNELKYLGAGYPILFNFYKFAIFLLFLLFLISGIFSMITNNQGNFCTLSINAEDTIENNTTARLLSENITIANPSKCRLTWISSLSLANKIGDPDAETPHQYLRIVFFVLMIFSFLWFRRFQIKTNALFDEQMNTPADYTVKISNIPLEDYLNYEDKLISIFSDNTAVLGKKYNVKKINLIYNSEEVEKIEHKLKKIIKKKKKLLKSNGFNLEDAEIHKLNKIFETKELELEKLKFKMIEKKANFAGKAFVSFNTEDEKEEIIKRQNVSFLERVQTYFHQDSQKRQFGRRLYYGNNLLYIEQAPEPNEINWENFHSTTKEKVKWRSIINLLFIFLLAFCFGVIYGISYYKSLELDHAEEALIEGVSGAEERYNTIFGLSIFVSILITSFNKFCLPRVVHLMVDHERYSNLTKLELSFAIKLALGCFFNTALITLGVEVLTFGNYYGVGGMIDGEHMIFIFNAFFAPLVWLIDPWTIQKNWIRRKILRKVEETGNKVTLTQEDANKLMEKVDYNIAKRYADILKTMWFTFFYAPAIPIGIVWSMVGLFVYYWIDKYNVFKRRTIKDSISIKLSMKMIDMLELCFICYGAGALIVESKFFQKVQIISIVVTVYGAAKFIFPINRMIYRCLKYKSNNENATYDVAHLEFETDYDRENPVTKHHALITFYKEKTEKKNTVFNKKIIGLPSIKELASLKEISVLKDVAMRLIAVGKQKDTKKNEIK